MNQTTARIPANTEANGAIAHALKSVAALTEQTGEQLQHGMMAASSALIHAAGALLEEAKTQSAAMAKGAQKEIREHPIASAASVIVASAAVIGLINAMRHHQAEQELEAHDDEEKKKKKKKDD